ncbi:MAG: class I SAM-dependent methyltransferase [bacterium]|nr:class I SAM-dependent methyltransferase [bacterium]
MKYILTPEGREYSPAFKKNVRRYIKYYNLFIKTLFLWRFNGKHEISSLNELNEIRRHALIDTDISDHLETLFNESMAVKPKLIVELGVRTGQSTFVFERVAKLHNAFLLSVDIAPQQNKTAWPRSTFIQKDDVLVADEFKDFCLKNNLEPKIDVLFIDTSHEYNHTKKEIEKWMPFLSPQGVAFFHDANVKLLYKRRNGTIGKAYNDDRDVMRAIEEYVGTHLNEEKDFKKIQGKWLIEHHAVCNGMTMLKFSN